MRNWKLSEKLIPFCFRHTHHFGPLLQIKIEQAWLWGLFPEAMSRAVLENGNEPLIEPTDEEFAAAERILRQRELDKKYQEFMTLTGPIAQPKTL